VGVYDRHVFIELLAAPNAQATWPFWKCQIRLVSARKQFLQLAIFVNFALLNQLIENDTEITFKTNQCEDLNVQRQVPRATTSQRCIRTNDIENVGKTSRHHTFFEMLGNFSFGDYFKKEAIEWAWELITIEFGLPIENLWISVYEKDEETYGLWHDGDLNDDTRFLEFYNLVFMQFDKKDGGYLEELKEKHIDTGMRLERMARILQKVPNNYETDLIFPIVEKAAELAKVSYAQADDSTKMKLKVIGDHMRAIVYLISDGVKPSITGRGYVLRRLIRRSLRMGKLLVISGGEKGNLEDAYLPIIAETVIAISSIIDPDLKSRKSDILETLKGEVSSFKTALRRGEKVLQVKLEDAKKYATANNIEAQLSGKDAFLLYSTYGYPIEMTVEGAQESGVSVDVTGFDIEKADHRHQS
ncbi:alanine--tRNA ligase, chloroplastic/mitochondrial, partial [Tanacetum coccineum]